ncbi:Uncharacterised protein [Mycobacterium tuberculosis]|nr:hypothetical protein HX91_0760 [Mycobacterium tuberculosis]COY91269.1 Uncharacterised protein [Mycobacterium tuberculosis]
MTTAQGGEFGHTSAGLTTPCWWDLAARWQGTRYTAAR